MDTINLAKEIFTETKEPPTVKIMDGFEPNSVRELFISLCDLYIYGIKIYNGLNTDTTVKNISELRKNTIEFMRERMIKSLSIEPILTVEQPDLINPCRYRFVYDENELMNCILFDSVLGTSLQFKFIYKS